MAGSSNFKIFDENLVNIMDDTAYSASTYRTQGAVSGVAPSNVHNKLYRQTSAGVAALMQVAANRGHVVDDSNYNGLITALTLAFAEPSNTNLQRSKAYVVGDIAYSGNLASYLRLECVTAGTTASTEPTWTGAGTTITDGTVVWAIDDVRDGLSVGSFDYSHILKVGRIKANGSLITRSAYPRLWKYVNDNSLAISEASWSNGMSGMFSVGDGITTFRLPDLRGEFLRGYDDGRGLDTTSLTGTVTSGSATITSISIPGGLTTNTFYVGQSITGTGIPVGATIASIVSDTSITISINATASATETIIVSGRKIGSMENDAIRNITGSFQARVSPLAPTGAFSAPTGANQTFATGTTSYIGEVYFNASNLVPTANENRPQNIALIAQIKY